MREFKLTNATGAVYDLMQTNGFLWNPDGLGWGYETGVADVGNALIPLDTAYTRPAPSGTMVFASYSDYATFLAFIQAGGLVLGYKPGNDWQYLDVSAIIGKSEIKPSTNRLICDIAFAGLSYWYEAPVSYASDNGRADFDNGALPSYCKITIDGAAANPVWTLYDSANNAVASGKITASIAAGDTLVINSRPRSMELREYDSGGDLVADRYSDSDFTTERFIEIPPGTGYYMTFADDNGDLTASIEVYKRV